MADYIITRHGSNRANQSMCPKMDVGLVRADNASDAIRKAWPLVQVYANQHLTALRVTSAPRRADALIRECHENGEDVYLEDRESPWA